MKQIVKGKINRFYLIKQNETIIKSKYKHVIVCMGMHDYSKYN